MALTKLRPAGQGFVNGPRNLIINGAMQVAQRGTSAVAVGNSTFRIDRFSINKTNDGAYTVEQSTDAPTGFTTSLKAQVTTADTSLSAAQYAYMYQAIEAKNLQHLNYGTSDALTVTLSFWVKSSKTGVYTASLYKQDNTGYMFTQEYTISSANTWEKKTITVTPTAGGTTFITTSGGAIANDSGAGIYVNFNLAFGSDFTGGTSGSWSSTPADYSTTNAVNWMDNTSNNFYLTGVQLELGENASDFEHRSYGEELALCQRYYEQLLNHSGGFNVIATYRASSDYRAQWLFKTEKRANPTMGGTFSGALNVTYISTQMINYYRTADFYGNSTLTADAEL